MGHLPTLPGCGRPAVRRIELYTGGAAYDSLDAAVYACRDHLADVVAAARAAGYTTHTSPTADSARGQRCGGGYDFTTHRAIRPGGAR